MKYSTTPSSSTIAYKKIYLLETKGKIILPLGVKREVASTYYQLKTGHGYLKSYLARIGKAASNKCRCGRPETTQHLLRSCRDLNIARRAILSRINVRDPSLLILLYTKIGIRYSLEFI